MDCYDSKNCCGNCEKCELMNNEVDRTVEIKLCLDLLQEYNSKVEKKENKFNIQLSEKDLNNMTLEKVKEKFKQIKNLIINQEKNRFLQNVIDETKKHGVDWVKEKYELK